MYESCEVVEAPAAPVDRLRFAAQLRTSADQLEAAAIAELAAEEHWDADAEYDVTRERAVRIGADGTPVVGEFLALEVAAARGTSLTAATMLIHDVLNVQHRHPALWQSIHDGRVPSYRAFQLARLCADFDLDRDEAAVIEDRLAAKYHRVSWQRIMRLARGLIAHLYPAKVAAKVEADRSERYLRTARSLDNPLLTHIWGSLDTPDAAQLDATLSALAKVLARNGDTDCLDVRRSRSLGILADPGRALALLETGHEDNRYLPRTRVLLHLNSDQLATGAGAARDDQLGPVTLQQLKDLFGTHRITVSPIIRVGGIEEVADSYNIPQRIRLAVEVRDGHEVFPWSSRRAVGLELDHTQPYAEGASGQTRASNLGPLSKRVHRAKTAKKWKLEQPRPGIFWWTSPRGYRYRVSPEGIIGPDESAELRVLRQLDGYPS